MQIRINKFLSEAGICSRRKADKYIKKGIVKINNKIAEQGSKINPEKDKIYFKNKLIKQKKLIYIILNKPKGYVSSLKHKGKKTILELVKAKERIYPVGRLDENSRGLLLLTNDGDLTLKLTHPRYKHEKEYIIQTEKEVPNYILTKLKKGVKLIEGKTQPCKIKKLNKSKYKIILKEGKKRQIRRMFRYFHYKVTDLKRTRILNLKLNLKQGKYRHLTKNEIKKLKSLS